MPSPALHTPSRSPCHQKWPALIRGDISPLEAISDINPGVRSDDDDIRHHVYTPPVGTELEANDQVKFPKLFPSGDGTQRLESREQFSELMASRSLRLSEVCNSTSEANRKFNFRSFYVLKVKCENISLIQIFLMTMIQSRSLVWCPVFKAASTNWMHNLLYLAGKNEFEVEQIMEEHPRRVG